MAFTRVCVQCQDEFTMSDKEVAFFEEKDLIVPRRCRSCRDSRRAMKVEAEKKQESVKQAEVKLIFTKGRVTARQARVDEIARKLGQRPWEVQHE